MGASEINGKMNIDLGYVASRKKKLTPSEVGMGELV